MTAMHILPSPIRVSMNPARFANAAAWVAVAMSWAASAAAGGWRLTVAAGDIDRSNLPIRAAVEVPEADLGLPLAVTLADGSRLVGQLSPAPLLARPAAAASGTVAAEIVFVPPKLPAGTTLVATVERLEKPPENPKTLAWKDESGGIDLAIGDRVLVRYEKPVYDPSSEASRVATYKPFHHVFDPETGTRLTKGDGGQYTHHRGIFFGYNRISHGAEQKTTSDCWHCKAPARQEHRSVLRQGTGGVEAWQRVAIDWIGGDGNRILSETRELVVAPIPLGMLIDFASRLESDAPVKLDGDPQHSGVHFRASNEVHESTKGRTYYLRPGVKAKPGEYRNWPADKRYVDAPWHGVCFVVAGRPCTVLRLNRIENPGEARMSERDYARFGSYFEASTAAGQPLEVGYRWIVHPGELELAEAERIAADYRSPPGIDVARQD